MSKQAVQMTWGRAVLGLAMLAGAMACGAARAEEPKCQCPVRIEVRRETGVPLLTKVPYINRLFKNIGVSSECCHDVWQRVGVDFDVAVAHEAPCQAATAAKTCGAACSTTAVSTAEPPCGKKCVDCPCTGPATAVAVVCGEAKTCPLTASCPVAANCPLAKACPVARTCPVVGALAAAGCPCREQCSTAACAANACPAAARCEQNRLPPPAFGLFGGIGEIMGFHGPVIGAWEPPPSNWEFQQAIVEVSMEKAALEAALEAREELHEARTEMFEMLAELLAEKGKAEARSEMFEVLAKVMTEKAKLEARVEAQAEQGTLLAEMHKLLAENARLKAHTELAGQREELMREALQLALENERLKHRVSELERQHDGTARTVTRPHASDAR